MKRFAMGPRVKQVIRWTIVCVSMLWSAAAAKPSPQTDKPTPDIAAFRATDYELVDSGNTSVVTIRLVIAPNVTPSSIRVDVVDAARDARHDPDLITAFTGTVSSDAVGPRLDLTVTLAKVSRPATYAVTLTLSDTDASANVRPVTQTVKLKHPAAVARLDVRTADVPFLRHGPVEDRRS